MSDTITLSASPVTPGFLESIKRDIPASIVVFLVALPLCMGISIASGMPPATGIITGIIAGIIVGTLGGSPLSVSGPAAGLSVMVYEIVQKVGPESLGIIVLIAGGIQILAGLLKFGQWFRAVSPAVIQGMLAGIGILIFASQFHVMVDDTPKGGGIANLISIPEAIYKGMTPLTDTSTHHLAAMVGLFTILIIMIWKSVIPKSLKVVPAPLAAVVLATLVVVLWKMPINRVTIPNNMMDAMTFPTWERLKLALTGEMMLAGLALAFVASAETLLCAVAVDKMHTGARTQFDRELTAQGAGNALCGLLGALPMTSVIVRSSANVQAGAKTRASSIMHGVWLLVFAAALPFVLRLIPTAGLAAILVFTGIKLMNVKAIKDLAQYGRGEVMIYTATVVMIVVSNLLTGVLVGVGLSIAKLLYTFSHLNINVDDQFADNRTIMHLRGTATFIRLPKLAAALETIRPNTELHIRMERLDYIDHACLDLLMNWEKQHESTGGRLVIDWDHLTAKFHREENKEPTVNNLQSG
ncbi:MAG: SulP family inorganic anion transporter [Planctomycetota bacterium]